MVFCLPFVLSKEGKLIPSELLLSKNEIQIIENNNTILNDLKSNKTISGLLTAWLLKFKSCDFKSRIPKRQSKARHHCNSTFIIFVLVLKNVGME